VSEAGNSIASPIEIRPQEPAMTITEYNTPPYRARVDAAESAMASGPIADVRTSPARSCEIGLTINFARRTAIPLDRINPLDRRSRV